MPAYRANAFATVTRSGLAKGIGSSLPPNKLPAVGGAACAITTNAVVHDVMVSGIHGSIPFEHR
jgi:hypothetical protein